MAGSGRTTAGSTASNMGSYRRVAADPLSDEAMAHLKSYKYSSVDKSLISNHILRHYVNLPSNSPPPKRD